MNGYSKMAVKLIQEFQYKKVVYKDLRLEGSEKL